MRPTTRADRSAVHVAPLLLRLALAATFLWAGLGKVLPKTPFSGADAAALASMGVIRPALPAPVDPATPVAPLPPAQAPAAPAPAPAPAPTEPVEGAGASVLPPLAAAAPAAPRTEAPAGPTRTFTAADFPNPVHVRRVYSLALTIYKAANPVASEQNPSAMRLWPQALGTGKWPVYFAWAVALTEIIGGVLVLLGLLTRLAAVMLAGVMLGAMWLTEIGPAIAGGGATLGFLPAYEPWYDPKLWTRFFWQLTLLLSALALAAAGSGTMALDRLGRSRRWNDDDDSL